MSVLPRVSGREVVAALARRGYEKDRQKDSHVVLRQEAYPPPSSCGSESQRSSKGDSSCNH